MLGHMRATGQWQTLDAGDTDKLPGLLAQTLDQQPGLLVINGGDGTVQVVMSALLNHLNGRNPPLIALLPGGTTNMTAHDVNGPDASFSKAITRLQTLTANVQHLPDLPTDALRRRRLLRLADGTQDRFGFFFGVGAVVDGIEYCHQRVYAMGITGALAPGLALLRAAFGLARGESKFSQPCPLTLAAGDAEPGPPAPASMLVASTLDRLFLGIRPFWGAAPAPVRYTLIDAAPRQFMRSLPALLRGEPGSRLTPANGYHSHAVESLKVDAPGRYTIDGEFFSMPDGALVVSATPHIPFVPLGRNCPMERNDTLGQVA